MPSCSAARLDTKGFHAYKSVAPLKRLGAALRLGVVQCFHAYKSVAPLKLTLSAGKLAHCDREFPRLQKRGPIEAAIVQALAAQEISVSTLTKAWPH